MRCRTSSAAPGAATPKLTCRYRSGDGQLWVVPDDDTYIWVVYPGHTERWPMAGPGLFCL